MYVDYKSNHFQLFSTFFVKTSAIESFQQPPEEVFGEEPLQEGPEHGNEPALGAPVVVDESFDDPQPPEEFIEEPIGLAPIEEPIMDIPNIEPNVAEMVANIEGLAIRNIVPNAPEIVANIDGLAIPNALLTLLGKLQMNTRLRQLIELRVEEQQRLTDQIELEKLEAERKIAENMQGATHLPTDREIGEWIEFVRNQYPLLQHQQE